MSVPNSGHAPAISKEELRREVERLLAGYAGSVTKFPAGVGTNKAGYCHGRKVERTKAKKTPNHTIDQSIPGGLVIYCDGCCEPNPGAGGWGFVVYRDGVEIHADCGGSSRTTNNIMELTGALRALEWVGERGVIEPLSLFCDSKYVVNGCNEWRHNWKNNGWNKRKPKSPKRDAGVIKNLDLWRELDAALTVVPVRLEWCKGHAGIIGNERADELSLVGREQCLDTEREADPIYQQLRFRA